MTSTSISVITKQDPSGNAVLIIDLALIPWADVLLAIRGLSANQVRLLRLEERAGLVDSPSTDAVSMTARVMAARTVEMPRVIAGTLQIWQASHAQNFPPIFIDRRYADAADDRPGADPDQPPRPPAAGRRAQPKRKRRRGAAGSSDSDEAQQIARPAPGFDAEVAPLLNIPLSVVINDTKCRC